MKKKTEGGWNEETYPTDKKGNYIIPVSDIGKNIAFHKIVDDNPKYYGTDKYFALKHDIEVNSYDSSFPIFVWRGKIVDGWHRVTICKELDIEYIVAEKLPHNTSLVDIEAKAKRTELGRQMTKTQLAIRGWKKWKDGTYKSVAQSALNIGTSSSSIKAVNYVAKHSDIDMIDELYKEIPVRYGDGIKMTDSVFTIKAFIEKIKKEEMNKTLTPIYTKMTNEEIELMKTQLVAVLEEKSPDDIKGVARFIFGLAKDAEEKSKG